MPRNVQDIPVQSLDNWPVDLYEATHVEVVSRREADGKTRIWVNIDGVCVVRVQKAMNVHLDKS